MDICAKDKSEHQYIRVLEKELCTYTSICNMVSLILRRPTPHSAPSPHDLATTLPGKPGQPGCLRQATVPLSLWTAAVDAAVAVAWEWRWRWQRVHRDAGVGAGGGGGVGGVGVQDFDGVVNSKFGRR
jgi:hypothetical protein